MCFLGKSMCNNFNLLNFFFTSCITHDHHLFSVYPNVCVCVCVCVKKQEKDDIHLKLLLMQTMPMI